MPMRGSHERTMVRRQHAAGEKPRVPLEIEKGKNGKGTQKKRKGECFHEHRLGSHEGYRKTLRTTVRGRRNHTECQIREWGRQSKQESA